ncbi:MAG TPA: response regulator [Anaerolineales bacterium]|nr:response regulator [Anaerolineales bacterium]
MSKPLALIVEDDPSLNEIIALTLQEDFELETCSDGDEAMELLGNVVPQVVVLDLNIPGIHGRDILAHIRSNNRFQRTHVIVATADGRQAEILQNEADIVLLKPVSPGQLRELALRVSSLK